MFPSRSPAAISNHNLCNSQNIFRPWYYPPMQAQVNNPMIAEWVKILITAVVGFASAVCLDMLKTRINERRKRKGLRKAMYDELASILGTCDAILEVENPTLEQAGMLMKVISVVNLDAYRMAKNDPV